MDPPSVVMDKPLVVMDPPPVMMDSLPVMTDQPSANIANMLLALQRRMNAITNRVATNKEALAELPCPYGASTSHPPPVVYSVSDPSPPVEGPHEPNLQEDLRVHTQPMKGLFPTDTDEIDPTMLRISKLEKVFEKSQGINSVLDIEDGLTETTMRLPERFKMSHTDKFDRASDPMVHIRLFSDVLESMGLTQPQKLSLFGRTLSGVVAIWYAKLEDSVK